MNSLTLQRALSEFCYSPGGQRAWYFDDFFQFVIYHTSIYDIIFLVTGMSRTKNASEIDPMTASNRRRRVEDRVGPSQPVEASDDEEQEAEMVVHDPQDTSLLKSYDEHQAKEIWQGRVSFK